MSCLCFSKKFRFLFFSFLCIFCKQLVEKLRVAMYGSFSQFYFMYSGLTDENEIAPFPLYKYYRFTSMLHPEYGSLAIRLFYLLLYIDLFVFVAFIKNWFYIV